MAALASSLCAHAQVADPNVSNYHADAARSGDYTFPGLNAAQAATAFLDPTFIAPVAGNVYAQPLYWVPPGAQHGYVIVATMSNNVEAHDAVSGALVWTVNLGQPTPSSSLPCGSQNPWGVAGTPVIDEASGTLYVDGEILVGGTAPTHEIFGISLAAGTILPGWPIVMDSAMAAKGYGFSSLIQDQRGGLALINGRIYVAYGGHGMDCGNYSGWVVEIHSVNPHIVAAWQSTGAKAGIWGPGGVTYDGSHLFVATGNTDRSTTTWSDGEAVIQLPLNVAHSTNPATYFSPPFWQQLDQTDKELGANSPVMLTLPSGQPTPKKWLFQLDKNGDVFVINRANLGGIGSGLLTLQGYVAPVVRTAPAAYPAPDGSSVFVAFAGAATNCPAAANPNYLTAMKVTVGPTGRPIASTAWCANLPGALLAPPNAPGAAADRGSPAVTTSDGLNDPIVWVLGTEGDELLHGYDGVTGAVVFDGGPTPMGTINRFSTPLPVANENRIYAAANNQLYAFSFAPPPPQQAAR